MKIRIFALDYEVIPGLEVREILPQGTTYEEAKTKAARIGKDNVFHVDGMLVKKEVIL